MTISLFSIVSLMLALVRSITAIKKPPGALGSPERLKSPEKLQLITWPRSADDLRPKAKSNTGA
jgi:hypothetical protein